MAQHSDHFFPLAILYIAGHIIHAGGTEAKLFAKRKACSQTGMGSIAKWVFAGFLPNAFNPDQLLQAFDEFGFSCVKLPVEIHLFLLLLLMYIADSTEVCPSMLIISCHMFFFNLLSTRYCKAAGS